MSQGPPNPGFMQEKALARIEDFLFVLGSYEILGGLEAEIRSGYFLDHLKTCTAQISQNVCDIFEKKVLI